MFAKRWRWLTLVIVLGLISLFGLPIVISLFSQSAPSNGTALLPVVEIIEDAPTTPILTVVSANQIIYHIDPMLSEARYRVREVILGALQGREVIGTTRAIRGDILVDIETPNNSQLGEILIDLRTLTSDSALRDQRLRTEYLESDGYPQARFVAERFVGLPENIALGQPYTAQIEGFLTVKDITARVTWEATLTLEAERVVGSARTQILMSTFEAGPINLIGLLQTEDVMELHFDFVAVPVTDEPLVALPPPAVDEAVVAAVYTGEGIEFHRDVRPILEASCVGCHSTGQIGFPVYPLVMAQDAVDIADDLAFIAQSGYMPPWFAGAEMPPLQHDPSLTDAEIETLVAWAAAGAPVDTTLDSPLQVAPNTDIQIRHDLVLEMPIPYQSPEGRTDDYRCFLLDPALTSQRYITGYEVLPGSVSIVHHVLVFPVPAEARAAAAAKSSVDGRPGWECFGGTGLTGLDSNTALAPGWVPGGGANQFPTDTGILLNPGDLLVFQVHYNLAGGSLPDQSTLILELSEPGDTLIALQGIGLIAPVEIPCPTAYRDTEPCQREFAIRASEALDPDAGLFADALLVICDRTVESYMEQDAQRVVSTCDSVAPIGGQAIQVNGHMHQLGASNRIELNPDSPDALVLLDLPRWDFNWQQNYTFVEPIRIEAGDRLRVTCIWDNTRGAQLASTSPSSVAAWERDIESLWGVGRLAAHDEVETQPYKYVTWGEGTRDEMCLSAVIVIPDPEFYDVVLTDDLGEDMNVILLGVIWMRLLQQPGILIMGGIAFAVVIGVVVLGVGRWRRRRLRPTMAP